MDRLNDEENVFDPHICTLGSGKRARQVYVNRSEKAARVVMEESTVRWSSLDCLRFLYRVPTLIVCFIRGFCSNEVW